MLLKDYVIEHTDIIETEQVNTPKDSVDLIFLIVIPKNNPDKRQFIDLINKEYPRWINGTHWNLSTIENTLNNRELALRIIGLGSILKVWKVYTPKTEFPGKLHKHVMLEMVESGMFTICTT